jgi:hypothetical protein
MAARQLRTYDVFDTAITRLVGDPTDIFLLVARALRQEGVLQHTESVCRATRIAAEASVRRAAKGGEATLTAIIEEFAWRLQLQPAQASRWEQKEIEVEEALCKAVPAVRADVAIARQQGALIQFISDMYLGSDVIRRLLLKEGLCTEHEKIWVSCELGASKRSGQMFSKIAETTNTDFSQWHHCGDRHDSDYHVPKQMGISASHVNLCQLNHFEKILETYSEATGGMTSLFAGTSRRVRLSVAADSGREKGLISVAAGVIAPLLLSYVFWIFKRANDTGVRRLYFVARDGHLLLEIARRLEKKLRTGIELRYLYGSRQAWHLASVAELTDLSGLDWITSRNSAEVTATDMLQRVGLTHDEVSQFLASSTYRRKGPLDDIAAVRAVLADPNALEFIKGRAKLLKHEAVGYFAQEGLLDDCPWALVDVGWRARAQRSLAHILAPREVKGIYFGLRHNACGEEAGSAEAFLFDLRQARGHAPSFEAFAEVIEMFCQAPHGTTLGYTRVGEKVEPKLKEKVNDTALRWGWGKVHEAVMCFTEQFPVAFFDSSADFRPCMHHVLDEFWRNPSDDEAEAWGSFEVQSDQGGALSAPLAPELGWRQVYETALKGTFQHNPWYWEAASLQRSSLLNRALLSAARRARTVVRQGLGR